jgi:hypothetical protein
MNIFAVIENSDDFISSSDCLTQIVPDEKLIENARIGTCYVTTRCIKVRLPKQLEKDDIFYLLISDYSSGMHNSITIYNGYIDIESVLTTMRSNLKKKDTNFQILQCKFDTDTLISFKIIYYGLYEVYGTKKFNLLYTGYVSKPPGFEYDFVPWFDESKEKHVATILERNKLQTKLLAQLALEKQDEVRRQKAYEVSTMEKAIMHVYPTQYPKIFEFIKTVKES